MGELRQRVLAGGAYLMGRQVISMAIGLVGVLLLTRLIGPRGYGRYAGSLAFVILLGSLGRVGIDVFLVRRPQAPDRKVYNQAFTVLLLFGLVVTPVAVVTLPLFISRVSDPSFSAPLRVLLLSVPINLLQTPAYALLERELNYRAIAFLDLGFQTLFYCFAVPLAAAGLGVWAPVTAWIAAQLVVVPATWVVAGLGPGLAWSRPLIREMLAYSLSFAASSWIWEARPLVNPIVVGRYLGPRAVGYVSIAIRIVDMLGFVRIIAYRLSIAAFAKVAGDYERLRRAMEESMALQVLATAPFLVGFALTADWLVPLLFGERWLPALRVFPYIALASLVNAVFNMEASTLYVLGRNKQVAVFHTVNVVLLVVGALVFVPRWGISGYGAAELVALTGYMVLHRQISAIFPISYASALPWLVALSPPLFWVVTPMPWKLTLFLPLVAVLLHRGNRRQLGDYLASLRPRPT